MAARKEIPSRRMGLSGKEKYLIDSKKFGVRTNRKLVHVRLSEVISLSTLDDVIEY